MKKLPIVGVVVVAMLLGSSLSWSADQPSAAQPTSAPSAAQSASGPSANQPVDAANPSVTPSVGTPVAAQTPPSDWTSLKGTVQSVDHTAKTVQIKDEAGSLFQVPISQQVSIQKNGKSIRLSQVQTGDTIVLAKRNSTPQDSPKTY